MATQVEHDLKHILAVVEKVKTLIKTGEIEKAVWYLEDLEDDGNMKLLILAGYSVEEAEEKIYGTESASKNDN